MNEFSLMVNSVREICELAKDFYDTDSNLYDKEKGLLPIVKKHSCIESHIDSKEKKGRNFGRSLFVSKDVKAGEIISLENIACVRPCFGMSPLKLDSILGKTFSKDIKGGMPLLESYIE